MPKGHKTDPELIERWRAMDAAGVNRTQIAREFNKHPSYISKILGAKQRRPANDNQGEPEAA